MAWAFVVRLPCAAVSSPSNARAGCPLHLKAGSRLLSSRVVDALPAPQDSRSFCVATRVTPMASSSSNNLLSLYKTKKMLVPQPLEHYAEYYCPWAIINIDAFCDW